MTSSLCFILWLIYLTIHNARCESVNCGANSCACDEAGFCELLCDGKDDCKGASVNLECYPGYPCQIQCSGTDACGDATWDYNGATALDVICNGNGACKGSGGELICGTSDCTLFCDNDSNNDICFDLQVSADMANSWQLQCTSNCNSINAPDNFAPNPTTSPTKGLSQSPSQDPTASPIAPTSSPTKIPTSNPTKAPSLDPTVDPTQDPTSNPTLFPSKSPSRYPTTSPTGDPTSDPTNDPSTFPSNDPTNHPTSNPSLIPSTSPTKTGATRKPSENPTTEPTLDPTAIPTTPNLIINNDAPTTSPLNDGEAPEGDDGANDAAASATSDEIEAWVYVVIGCATVFCILCGMYFRHKHTLTEYSINQK